MENFFDYVIPALIFGIYIFSNLFGARPVEEKNTPQPLDTFFGEFPEEPQQSFQSKSQPIAAAKKIPQKNFPKQLQRPCLSKPTYSTTDGFKITTSPCITKLYFSDRETVRKAFILHEIIGPPVVFRKQSRGHPLIRPL